MLNSDLAKLLKEREFISIATCDFQGRPNVVPKFILKIDNSHIYLVDYVLGTTYNNIKVNPRISLSIMNVDHLTGYQINGTAQLITSGEEFKKLRTELTEKQVQLSAKRVIDALRGKRHDVFEVGLPEHSLIIKIKIEEVVEISVSGKLKREKLGES